MLGAARVARLLAFGCLLALGCSRKPDATTTPASSAAPAPLVDAALGPEPGARSLEPGSEPSARVLRAEKPVVVDGVTETWRLVWRRPPMPACIDETWRTCPCAGLAFGETGDMDLVRSRPGAPDEKLDLTKIDEDFTLQRWVPAREDEGHDKVPFADIQKRPVADVMKLGDYDHDGRATELVIRLSGPGPCGHAPAIVVGISRKSPHLHAFATPEKPNEYLVLESARDWERVREKVPVTLVGVPCGDHGAEKEESLAVTADAAGLHTRPSTRSCK